MGGPSLQFNDRLVRKWAVLNSKIRQVPSHQVDGENDRPFSKQNHDSLGLSQSEFSLYLYMNNKLKYIYKYYIYLYIDFIMI